MKIDSYYAILCIVGIAILIVSSVIHARRKVSRIEMRRRWEHLISEEGSDYAHHHFLSIRKLCRNVSLTEIGCPDLESLQQAACVSILRRRDWLRRRFNYNIANMKNFEALPIGSERDLRRLAKIRDDELTEQIEYIAAIKL